MKLSRKAIREGLDQVPIEAVLIGVNNAAGVTLSPKEREFARQLALGESKAGAYRKSRETKAKPETASRRGQEIAARSAVQAQVEAFRLAIEAEKSRTPAHLRALVVQKLTEKALDPECPPAQQIKALELLGKITEVALFTERREVVQVKDSGEIRARLMDSIRQAIRNSASDADVIEADSLLAEISSAKTGEEDNSHSSSDRVTIDEGDSHYSGDIVTDQNAGGTGVETGTPSTPPGGTPLDGPEPHLQALHSIPHSGSTGIDSPTDITSGDVK